MKDRHEAQARQRRRAHARAVKVVDQSCTEGNCMEDVTGMGVDGAPVLADTTTGKWRPYLGRIARAGRAVARLPSELRPRKFLASGRGAPGSCYPSEVGAPFSLSWCPPT